jgi:hypothetical protein
LDVRRELLREHGSRPPEISIEGLNELATIAALVGANRKRGAQSCLSTNKEMERAKKTAASNRAQVVLELERHIPATPVERNTKGLWPIFCWRL